jgi:hypothetical protein
MTKPQKIEGGKKDCLFQYATKHKVIEDTGLITRKEADELVQKYLQDLKDNWDEFDSPQMAIWIDCDSNTDYHTMGLDIDYRDCELENEHFYRITKTKLI